MRKISDILKETRLKKGLQLIDVEKETKIKLIFLEALERGDFKKLPSESYALGFVKTYASYLGMSQATAAALFRREYESKQIDIMPTYKKKQPGGRKRISFKSPKGFFILFFGVLLCIYLIFQFSFLFMGPKLAVDSPKEGQLVTSNIIQVSGKTDPYATILVNGEEIYVDLSGSFKKNMYVHSGEQDITIISKSRYGKETKKEIQVRVE